MMAGSSGFVQEFSRAGSAGVPPASPRPALPAWFSPDASCGRDARAPTCLSRGELLNLDRKPEIWPRIPAPPAVHVPARLQEPDFRALAKVQGGRSQAA